MPSGTIACDASSVSEKASFEVSYFELEMVMWSRSLLRPPVRGRSEARISDLKVVTLSYSVTAKFEFFWGSRRKPWQRVLSLELPFFERTEEHRHDKERDEFDQHSTD